MRKVLIVDQMSGINPAFLQQNPTPFEVLLAEVEAGHWPSYTRRKPQVLEVEESFTPPYATTVFAADENGNAFMWKCRWDSSG